MEAPMRIICGISHAVLRTCMSLLCISTSCPIWPQEIRGLCFQFSPFLWPQICLMTHPTQFWWSLLWCSAVGHAQQPMYEPMLHPKHGGVHFSSIYLWSLYMVFRVSQLLSSEPWITAGSQLELHNITCFRPPQSPHYWAQLPSPPNLGDGACL